MIPVKPLKTMWTDEQWEAIYREGKNVIISAGAGSGKTAVLTERILEKVKRGIDLRSLIVLTFTNAAAAEMKTRIRKKLKAEIAKGNTDLKVQLENLDQAMISTFDSFSLFLVKKYHYLLHLDRNISIADNVIMTVKKREIMNDLFEEKYTLQDPHFLSLIDTYCEKDDAIIRDALFRFYAQMELIFDQEDYIQNYISTYYNEAYIKQGLKDVNKILFTKIKSVQAIHHQLKQVAVDEKFIEYADALFEQLIPLYDASDYDEVKEIVSSLRLKSVPSSKNLDEAEKAQIKLLKEEMNTIVKEIKAFCTYESLSAMQEHYLLTQPHVETILSLIEELDSRIKAYKYTSNTFEFIDIGKLAIQLLIDHPDISSEIREATNEIMIDEYQDTNDLQDLFIAQISNNNVYMVGDVKQSIYRFRNANPLIFSSKYNNYKEGNGGYKIDLSKNFRSRVEVIDGINDIFNIIMDDEIGGVLYKGDHALVFGNLSFNEKKVETQDYQMKILNYIYNDLNEHLSQFKQNEIEAFLIAYDIKNKVESKYQMLDKETGFIRDCRYDDFAILIDRKTSFDLYKQLFEYMGIPLTIHKEENFVYSDEIYVIKNLLILVLSMNDFEFLKEHFNHAFVSVCRSFLLEISDEEISKIFAESKLTKTSILKLMNDETSVFYELYTKIRNIAYQQEGLTIDEILLLLYREFKIYENTIKIGNVKDIEIKLNYLLDKAKSLASTGFTLKMFIEYFENIQAIKTDIQFSIGKDLTRNSCNIMTIHKSKGLEFNVCYFPELYRKFMRADMKERFVFDNKYGIVIPFFKEGLGETFVKELVKSKYIEEDLSERLRVLYVALTRAKEQVIIVTDLQESRMYAKDTNGVIPTLDRIGAKSFKDVLQLTRNDLEHYIKQLYLEDFEFTKDYQLTKITDYTSEIQLVDERIEYRQLNLKQEELSYQSFSKTMNELITKQDRKMIDAGLLFHKYLESIDFLGNIEEQVSLLNCGDFYSKLILNFFENDLLDTVSEAKIYKEYKFSFIDADQVFNGVIDLMLEYPDYIDLVDYKLKDVDDVAYIKQLHGYKNYIEKISNKKVNLYLYSIIDSQLKQL